MGVTVQLKDGSSATAFDDSVFLKKIEDLAVWGAAASARRYLLIKFRRSEKRVREFLEVFEEELRAADQEGIVDQYGAAYAVVRIVHLRIQPYFSLVKKHGESKCFLAGLALSKPTDNSAAIAFLYAQMTSRSLYTRTQTNTSNRRNGDRPKYNCAGIAYFTYLLETNRGMGHRFSSNSYSKSAEEIMHFAIGEGNDSFDMNGCDTDIQFEAKSGGIKWLATNMENGKVYEKTKPKKDFDVMISRIRTKLNGG